MNSRDANPSFNPDLLKELYRSSAPFQIDNARSETGKKIGIAFTKALCEAMMAHQDFDVNHYTQRFETKVEGTRWLGECWVEYIGDKGDKSWVEKLGEKPNS